MNLQAGKRCQFHWNLFIGKQVSNAEPTGSQCDVQRSSTSYTVFKARRPISDSQLLCWRAHTAWKPLRFNGCTVAGRKLDSYCIGLIFPASPSVQLHNEQCWNPFSCFINLYSSTIHRKAIDHNVNGLYYGAVVCLRIREHLNLWYVFVKPCLARRSHVMTVWAAG